MSLIVWTKGEYKMGNPAQFFINSYLRLASISDDPFEKKEYMHIAKKMLEEYADIANIEIENDFDVNGFKDETKERLIEAIKEHVVKGKVVNISYDEMRDLHGADIFGMRQPKKILDFILDLLEEQGISIATGKTVKYQGRTRNGFGIFLHEKGE